MKRKQIYILTALTLTFCTANAQKTYTLDDCRSMALQNNLKLKNSQLDVDMAIQGKKEAFTGYFPTISAGGTIFQGFNNLLQADMEMAQTKVPLSAIKKGAMASVMAVQPIFTGLRIINGNKLAQIQHDASQLKKQMTEKEVIQKTVDYYWQIASLKGKMETMQSADKQLEEVYRQVDLSVKAGLTTRNDLLRIELRRQELSGNMLEIGNNIKTVKMMLAQHMGIPRDSFDIEVKSFYNPEAPYKFYTDPQNAAITRQEYRLSQINTEACGYEVKMERGKNMPTVSIGIGDMYYNLMDKNVNNGVVFATVSIPISSWWGGSHSIAKAKIKQVQAQNAQRETEELLAIDVEQAWNKLTEAYAQIDIARHSVESATENLRLNKEYFKAGTTTLTDLLDAESLLTESRNKLTSACTDYMCKLSNYKLKTE